ncbi:MAG: hypothetical protein GXP56_14860 [Deltaproteobacteria bacterium]|nr:hypothetical protein [Deltaproteobacteria bacterium]
MTAIPGHNIVIQQSGVAQELTHQANTPKPSPEQAVAQQEVSEIVTNTTVQEFDEAEKLKTKKEKEALIRRQKLKEKKKKREKKKQEKMDPDPDAPGRLLDTTA